MNHDYINFLIEFLSGNYDYMQFFASQLQHRDAGADGGGQSLVSPGSCLEEFRVRPFIECRGLGTCNFFATATSYWLATIREDEMFRKPLQQTLKADHTSRVSRCAVCIRQRVSEDPYSRTAVLKPFTSNNERAPNNVYYPPAPPPRYPPDYQPSPSPPNRERYPSHRRVPPYHYRRRGRVRSRHGERPIESSNTL